MRAKVIAVWGYKGKTTCAVNLAWTLIATKKEKLATLLSANLTMGDIQGYFGMEIKEKHGMQAALESDEHARKFLWRTGEEVIRRDIFLMTLPNGVDSLLCEQPSLDAAERMIEQLGSGEHNDYLIIDCTADLHNPLTGVALSEADIILCLHQPGSASFQWFQGMRSFREQLGIDQKMRHILYAHDNSCSAQVYVDKAGVDIFDELPFVKDARNYENQGIPICAKANWETRAYIRAMERLSTAL